MANKSSDKKTEKSGKQKGKLSLFARLLTALAWIAVLLLWR